MLITMFDMQGSVFIFVFLCLRARSHPPRRARRWSLPGCWWKRWGAGRGGVTRSNDSGGSGGGGHNTSRTVY